MNTSASSHRLATGLAIAAVAVTALGAAATGWMGRSMGDAPDAAAMLSARPAADAAVRVVKAPAERPVQQQPAAARGCAESHALESSL